MYVGLGLPISDPVSLLDWARRADAGPFRTLGLLDRLVFDNPEPLVTLAAIAGATSRIRVQTEVLLAPLREPALLAKQAATLDLMSGGRLTLGLGVGGRDDDHVAAGVDIRDRGRRLDRQMDVMRRLWSGAPYADGAGPIGPAPHRTGGPEVLFGGFAKAALDRVARWGDGFLGAGPLGHVGMLFRAVEQSWVDAGRTGRPKLVAQVSAALGDDRVVDRARAAIGDYYRFTDRAGYMVDGLLSTPSRILGAISEAADHGADEVMLYCWAAEAEQCDRLADLVA